MEHAAFLLFISYQIFRNGKFEETPRSSSAAPKVENKIYMMDEVIQGEEEAALTL